MNWRGQIPFGQLLEDGGPTNYFVTYGGDAHLLTIAGAREGKFRDQLVQSIFALAGCESTICVDPKGQAAATTYAGVQELGSRVVIINPCNWLSTLLPGSVGYNPMATLDPASRTFGIECDMLAEALIWADARTEQHWITAPRELVSGLIMFYATYGEPYGQ